MNNSTASIRMGSGDGGRVTGVAAEPEREPEPGGSWSGSRSRCRSCPACGAGRGGLPQLPVLVIASRMGGGFMVAVRLLVLTTVALRTAGAPTAPTKHIEGHLRPAISRVARRASASECAQGAWAWWRYGGGSAGAPSALARPHGGAVAGSELGHHLPALQRLLHHRDGLAGVQPADGLRRAG